jgi:hypothetical protein
MRFLLAAAVGFAVGAQAGRKESAEFRMALAALRDSEEMAGVVAAARAQLGTALRELASVIDSRSGDSRGPDPSDLVAHVRRLVGED